MSFDAPDREKCSARRTLTNTPLQALTLLNDPTYVEASRSLAERMLLEGGKTPVSRIEYGFRLATGRPSRSQETAILRETLNSELLEYQHKPAEANKLLSTGEAPVNSTLDAKQLAAWTVVASMILNLDETITKE
jgi:hypothetical protein